MQAPRRRNAALAALKAAAVSVVLAALLVLAAAAWIRRTPPSPGIASLRLSADGTTLLGVPRGASLAAVRRRLIDAFAAAAAAAAAERVEPAGAARRLMQRGRGGNIRAAALPGVFTAVAPVSLRRASGVRRASHHAMPPAARRLCR